jgi:hypothetical protein
VHSKLVVVPAKWIYRRFSKDLLNGEQKRRNPDTSNTGETAPTISAKPVGVGAVSHRLIPTVSIGSRQGNGFALTPARARG